MELITNILFLTFTLGIPVLLLTWYLFSRLYDRGELDIQEDPGKAFKAHKKRSKKTGLKERHLVQKQWMKFGGGYYGLTALWTLLVIEIIDITQFVMNFPGFSVMFADGIISFVINFFVNQLQNFLTAFLWFGYWEELLVSLAVSYGGYLLGMNAAKEGFRIRLMPLKLERQISSDS